MSPKNRIFAVGLTVMGICAGAPAATRAADPPPPPAPRASKDPSVLLLSNGRVLQGDVSQEGNDVVVRQRGGVIRKPKNQVVGCFPTVAAVYEYQREQVPDGDPDEHLKLARWCLTVKLLDAAKAEIQKVLAVSPRSSEARAMLVSIEADQARRTEPRTDADVVRTSAEMPAAEPVNPAILQKAERELGINGAPVIFDLPASLAVKRAQSFASAVHPVLQASCVKCHNETSGRAFQLVEVKNGKRLSGDALRANLDATLLLIDRDNLANSELLSVALVPHGNAASKRPIFTGANDRRFMIVQSWVNSLQTKPSALGVAGTPKRPSSAPRESAADSASGFATERNSVPQFTPTPSPSGQAVMPDLYGRDVDPAVRQTRNVPPTTFVPGRGLVPDADAPPGKEFPLPFAVTGQAPKTKAAAAEGASGAPAAKPAATPPAPPVPGSLPPLPAAGPAEPTSKPAATPEPAAAPKTAAAPKKPVKIDRSLLERAPINRNAGAPGTGP